MSTKTVTLTQQQKMVQGTFWSTLGNFLSRLLGALYIIPWYIWMGKQHAPEANALFSMGYNIYAIILLVSTSGINVAVSKQIAKYNTLDDTDYTALLIRVFLKLMLLSGVIFAGLMVLTAPLISQLTGVGNDLVPILYSLSFSVLVFPLMSVLRGIFQGYSNLKPYALSQIMEQIVRVIWMLLTTFFIMKLGSHDYKAAVVQSTFAAFVGMLSSLGVLVYFLWKEKLLTVILKKPTSGKTYSLKPIIIETIKEALPFIITGAAIQLFQNIDQLTYINAMTFFTTLDKDRIVVLFSYLSANPNKIIMILVAVAASIGGVGIPLLTENFVKKDQKAMARLILNNFQMLLIFLLPAISGALMLARPLYTLFYNTPEPIALSLFAAMLFQTFLLAAYTVLSPMLQAIFENKKAIRYFVYGLIVKLVTQIPFIYLFQSYGPILATNLGLLLPVILMYKRIQKVTKFNSLILKKRSLLIAILTLIMVLGILPVLLLLNLFIRPDNFINSFIYISVVGTVGIGIFLYLTLKIRLLDKFIDHRADALRQKLRIS